MGDALAMVYGRRSPQLEAAAVTGTPADCVRGIREVEAAGAELILFTCLFDQTEHAERLAAEIIPALQAG